MTSTRSAGRGSSGGASPARRAAFEVLSAVEAHRGEPASLLHHPRNEALSPADRDLATEIVLGVLRLRASLDFVLAHHATRPLASLDRRLLIALRIGLYQIRHLDRVPHRAAVDESVRLADASGAGRGKGLVNAVLRSVLRAPGVPALPRKEDDAIAYLTTTLSHPRWLAERYLERLGLDGAEARCRRQNQPPPVHVRVSPRIDLELALERLREEGLSARPVPQVPRCLRVDSGSVAKTELFREGLLLAQDAGSQLVPRLLDLEPDSEVLDLCAAPGGKSTQIAERVPEGRVIALDRRLRRLRLLQELAGRWRADNLLPVLADGARLPLARRFSRILLDVPCSSLGTLRRNPDVKWRVTESDLPRFAELQRELLLSASARLAPGGRLVYSTCSTEAEENEEVVHWFLSRHPEFRLLDPRDSLPESARHMGEEGWFRTLPERDDMDGYFAGILAL